MKIKLTDAVITSFFEGKDERYISHRRDKHSAVLVTYICKNGSIMEVHLNNYKKGQMCSCNKCKLENHKFHVKQTNE